MLPELPSRHHGNAQSPQTASSQHARGRCFLQETTESLLSPSGVLGVRTGHQGNLTSGVRVCTHTLVQMHTTPTH